MTKIGIYKITSPSNHIYIGQSRDIDRRINVYRKYNCIKQPRLYNSLIKYGFENHKIEIVLNISESANEDVLDMCEVAYIKYYKNIGSSLLNLTDGGRKGFISNETKLKIRKSRTGLKQSLETIEKIKATKKLRSENRTTKRPYKNTEGQRYAISRMNEANKANHPSRGRQISEAQKIKVRESHKRNGIIKSIMQYTKDRVFVKKWDCISEAARHVKSTSGKICRSAKNGGLTRGFIWTRESICM